MYIQSTFTDTMSSTFSSTICTFCGLCAVGNETAASGNIISNPGHCLILFNTDQDNFMKTLKFLVGVRKRDIVKYMDYLTFEGFCGLFCNNWCPFTSKQCLDIMQPIDCYVTFMDQASIVVTPEMKSEILKKYSGIEVSYIGTEFRPTNLKLDKKEKKTITRSLHRAMKAFSKSKKRKLSQRVKQPRVKRIKETKKEVSTLFFYRENDPEWEAKINRIIGEGANKVEQT